MPASRAEQEHIVSTPPPGPTRFVLVPHTHWDREWYEPFEVFRARLVAVLDDVLDRLESDADFRFTLDGQAAAIVDYLEIRPENTERVRAQAARGALALGPWYILMDEFSCSGETIVRNLERGRRVSSGLGGTMPVGHLPDMFGHTAQMPQVLTGFGIGHAVLWRGTPAAVERHAFTWRSPDGSGVRVENLFDGYANALDLFTLPDRFDEEVDAYARRSAPWWAGDPMLGLVGADHTAPTPILMDLVRGYAGAGDVRLEVGTLADYVAAMENTPAPRATVEGELRSHARGNLLPGVFSIRVMLKDAMARAEDAVVGAEALDAVHRVQDDEGGGTAPLLDLAWRRVIESTAHDSVTGCGVDATADQVTARLESAGHLARAVRDAALAPALAATPADAVLAVNQLAWDRAILVEADAPVPGDGHVLARLSDGTDLPTQWLADLPTVLGDEEMASGDLGRILHRIHGRELFGQLIESYEWGTGSLTFHVSESPSTVFDLPRLRAEIDDAMGQAGPWRVRTLAEPRARILAEVPVPALGHAAARLVPSPGEGPGTDPGGAASDVRVEEVPGGIRMTGEGIDVVVEPDGTCVLTGADGTVLRGVGRIVDEGDRGDSYNFGPMGVPAIRVARRTRVEVLERGPLRGRVRIERVIDLPVAADPTDPSRRAVETVAQTVETVVEVRRGEPLARFAVSFVNAVRDHRMRLLVPTAAPTDHTLASGQFGLTRRDNAGEGGWGEFPLPTYPVSEHVVAGGAHVLVDKLTEYELVRPDGTGALPGAPLVEGEALAVTLVRCVGQMSVNVHPLRDEPAGSQIPVPGAQYEGVPVTVRLAVMPSSGTPGEAGAGRWAQVLRSDGYGDLGTGPRGGGLPAPVAGIRVEGPAYPSAVRRLDGGEVEVRLVPTTDVPASVAVHGLGETLVETDLAGGPVAVHPAGAVPVRPARLVTLRARRP